jgi:signal transduction histidine kinase
MSQFLIGLGLGVLLAAVLAAVAWRRHRHRLLLLERRAQAAERLAELGTMTGGLAHEIKNPLSTVNLNIQLLQEDLREVAGNLPPDDPNLEQLTRTQRRIDSLSRETQRVRDILEDFLRFAGRIRLDVQPADVNTLVDELADFFEPQAQAANIRVRTQFDAHPAIAPIDAALVKQAVLNLLINAVQAMSEARVANPPVPHGGCAELIIRTSTRQKFGHNEVVIHVIDTGPGIANDRIAKIWQPYFSSKKNGTGLGLPTTRRIIQEHGGSIDVHSEPGRGTDFAINLPIDREKLTEQK